MAHEHTQTRINNASLVPTPPYRPNLSGRTCPADGTHYGGDTCPVCDLRIKQARLQVRLEQAEYELSKRPPGNAATNPAQRHFKQP